MSASSSLLDPALTFPSLMDSIGIDNRLKKAVQRLGHVRPTLVQSKCLPLAITSGRDLLVRAKTGSGKTLAYCLPVIQKILHSKSAASSSDSNNNDVRSVILVPTRELCSQVYKTLQSLVYYCDDIVTLALLSATTTRKNNDKSKQDLIQQKAMLRDRPDIIVATPAGLLTHIRNGDVNLKTSVETLVVDEADLVLSFGYSNDISEIVKSLPKICQGLLMSATLSPELNSLKKIVLHSPVVLKLEQDEAKASHNAKNLMQFYLTLPKKDKNLIIYVFLKLGLLKGKGLFFVNTTDGGYRLKLFLEQFHIRSSVLNAELPFRSRLNIIEQFNVGNFDYLIATDDSSDVASPDEKKKSGDSDEDGDSSDDDDDDRKQQSNNKKRKNKDEEYGVSRGLDFRNVSFVVNVDFPSSKQSYSHRVGRTARGGAKGVALSLVESENTTQHHILAEVQDDQPKIPISNTATETLQAVGVGDEDYNNNNNEATPTEQSQPSPLDFDLNEIEGFRYRVEDVARAVTRAAVKETRAAELRAEILNSEKLQSHFEENPSDLNLLRHDRVATHVSKVQDHLKHVPKYLLPRGMQVAATRKRRRKKKKKKGTATGQFRSTGNDPLQSFNDGDVNLDGLGGGGDDKDDGDEEECDDEEMPDFSGDGGEQTSKKQKTGAGDTKSKVFTSTRDVPGRSTAGRNAWKERHGKGKFSGKKRKSERKIKQPLGV